MTLVTTTTVYDGQSMTTMIMTELENTYKYIQITNTHSFTCNPEKEHTRIHFDE